MIIMRRNAFLLLKFQHLMYILREGIIGYRVTIHRVRAASSSTTTCPRCCGTCTCRTTARACCRATCSTATATTDAKRRANRTNG
jgi:hypothetical protein